MDYNSLLGVLLGAGSGGAIASVVNIVTQLRKGKLDSEETLIARLNLDSRQQGERADKAEAELAAARASFEGEAARLRQQRDRARDRAAQLRTQLIMLRAKDVPTLDDLYE